MEPGNEATANVQIHVHEPDDCVGPRPSTHTAIPIHTAGGWWWEYWDTLLHVCKVRVLSRTYVLYSGKVSPRNNLPKADAKYCGKNSPDLFSYMPTCCDFI